MGHISLKFLKMKKHKILQFVLSKNKKNCFQTSCFHLVAKNVVRYLNGIVDYVLKYEANQNINLHGYVDLEWEGSATNRKSTSVYYFSLGSVMITWFNRKQSCVAPSRVEAEYVATCSASCEAVWLRKILFDLFDLDGCYLYILRQLELCEAVREPSVP